MLNAAEVPGTDVVGEPPPLVLLRCCRCRCNHAAAAACPWRGLLPTPPTTASDQSVVEQLMEQGRRSTCRSWATAGTPGSLRAPAMPGGAAPQLLLIGLVAILTAPKCRGGGGARCGAHPPGAGKPQLLLPAAAAAACCWAVVLPWPRQGSWKRAPVAWPIAVCACLLPYREYRCHLLPCRLRCARTSLCPNQHCMFCAVCPAGCAAQGLFCVCAELLGGQGRRLHRRAQVRLVAWCTVDSNTKGCGWVAQRAVVIAAWARAAPTPARSGWLGCGIGWQVARLHLSQSCCRGRTGCSVSHYGAALRCWRTRPCSG